MTRDNRPRAMAGGGLWAGVIALTQAALATDPFRSLTTSAVAISIVLTAVYLLEGAHHRHTAEKERSWN